MQQFSIHHRIGKAIITTTNKAFLFRQKLRKKTFISVEK
jgi:hypothetical protein